MRFLSLINRQIPIQQLVIFGIAINVISRACPGILHRTAALPALARMLNGTQNLHAIRGVEIRPCELQPIMRRIARHWQKPFEVRTPVRNASLAAMCACGSHQCQRGHCGSDPLHAEIIVHAVGYLDICLQT
jgi:hypothetical protein